ncbi:MAG: N-acetylmuramoyl-L-alanine amidase, partial [Kofleriaceae bacterium]
NIVNFQEPPYWDARSELCKPTRTEPAAVARCTLKGSGQVPYGNLPIPYTKRYSTRPALRTSKWNMGENAPYDAVKQVIKQFVIHHDGCASADMCWNVLQNERGLSCHFLVDNDGTIYQTLDLALMGYHAAEWNLASIGVELCNRGDAKKEPNYYKGKRETRAAKINGHTFLAFDYTPQQYEELTKLCKALLRLLPNLPAEYPQSSPGVQSWDTLPGSITHKFAGYIGHYHLTNQKWDPGYFDFKQFCSKLRGSFCFPVFPREPAAGQTQPTVPAQTSALKEASDLLYKMNEQRADGGFFPVGPWGEQRLWHGGVHLVGKAGDKVFSPFPGRLVAARMGATSSAGSVNFVLLRHSMSLGTNKVDFFSLYMHLADELAAGAPVEWMVKAAAKVKDQAGKVVLLDEPIEAGAHIGHVGTAGPAELSKAQTHVEIFANSHVFDGWPGAPWEVIDGTSGGRFSDAPRVNEAIDSNKDGLLSRQELASYYGGGAQQPRYMVTQHVSEWHAEPSWADALRASKDYKSLKPEEIDQLVAEQITPGLWWDAQIAAHARLNADGVVYHYHPVSFVSWFNQQILDEEAAQKASGKPQANASDAKEVPPGVTDDLGDFAGTSMRSTEDFVEDPCNAMTLQDLVKGFDAGECATP